MDNTRLDGKLLRVSFRRPSRAPPPAPPAAGDLRETLSRDRERRESEKRHDDARHDDRRHDDARHDDRRHDDSDRGRDRDRDVRRDSREVPSLDRRDRRDDRDRHDDWRDGRDDPRPGMRDTARPPQSAPRREVTHSPLALTRQAIDYALWENWVPGASRVLVVAGMDPGVPNPEGALRSLLGSYGFLEHVYIKKGREDGLTATCQFRRISQASAAKAGVNNAPFGRMHLKISFGKVIFIVTVIDPRLCQASLCGPSDTRQGPLIGISTTFAITARWSTSSSAATRPCILGSSRPTVPLPPWTTCTAPWCVAASARR